MRTVVPVPNALLQSLNATPLMDVMLVLLVVFMVVTPLIHSGPDLVLPSGKHGEPEPEEQVLTVRLNLRGELRSETGSLSAASLANVIQQDPGIILLIEADRRLPYSRIEELLATVQAAGLRQVTLVALRRGTD
jgi:biopolymer transport protein ExbD